MSGTANREIDYRCADCGEEFSKDELVAKQARFLTLGVKGRHLRTRITKWLCKSCLDKDPDYNLERWGRNRTAGVKQAS